MILTWMVYTLLVSALIAVAARGLEEVGRAFRLPVRFVWVAAVVVTLVLAALAPTRSTAPGPDVAVPVVQLSAVTEGAGVAAEGPGVRSATSLSTVRRALEWPLRVAAGSVAGEPWLGAVGAGLGVVWLSLALGLLATGIATSLRYRSARRRWPLREIFGTQVRVSPAAGPAVLGVLRPEIVVPRWLLETSPAEQHLVVLHEREHLRAGDALTLTFGWVAVALVPWNPVMWWVLSRLRLAVELDCDARVLRRDVGRQEYGSMLIDIAGHGSGLSLGVPALAGSPSNLERRLLAMTTSFSRPALMRAAGLGALGALALVAACEARMPTAAEIDGMDAASAEAEAERWKLVAPDSGVTWFIDGEEATAEEAHAIAADRLARVEVVRAAGEGGEIRLMTHAGDRSIAADSMAIEGTDPETGERRRLVALRAQSADDGEGHRLTVRGDTLESFSGLKDGFDGLMLIDGVDAGPELEGLKDLRPSDIERIEVIKGPAATRLYDDPRAANGVVRIVTKEGAGTG